MATAWPVDLTPVEVVMGETVEDVEAMTDDGCCSKETFLLVGVSRVVLLLAGARWDAAMATTWAYSSGLRARRTPAAVLILHHLDQSWPQVPHWYWKRI